MPIKKKENSKKKETLDQIIDHIEVMKSTDIPKFLTAVIQGKIKDYGTMEATTETKLKYAKVLMDILSENEVREPPKEIKIVVEDMTDETRLKTIEEDLWKSK
jgi:hypothetical protein